MKIIPVKNLILIISGFLLISGGLAGFYLYNSRNNEISAAKQFVNEFLEIRYNDTNFNNIEKRCDALKIMMDKSLLNSGYRYGSLDESIVNFKKNKISVDISNKSIYESGTTDGLIYICAKAGVIFHSELDEKWEQKVDYDLKFILKKSDGNKYIINYIDVLDTQSSLSAAASGETHEHE